MSRRQYPDAADACRGSHASSGSGSDMDDNPAAPMLTTSHGARARQRTRSAQVDPIEQRKVRARSGMRSANPVYHTPLPWRSLVLTVFLLLFGIISLVTSVYLFAGFGHDPSEERWKPLAIMGTLCIIPGGYYAVYFACALLGLPGYDYAEIPDL
ncbi:hypothetical protein GGF31_002030 [Allomyces arbusculus]|nr:hypothetical protein GGF31_002030 [Allomyces arbusculus]